MGTWLVLHGNGMNGSMMASVVRRLRKKAGHVGIDLVFPWAPYVLGSEGVVSPWTPYDQSIVCGEHTPAFRRQWWPEFLTIEDIPAIADTEVTTEPCLAWLEALVEEREVCGLIGFSQGGHVAGRLVARLPGLFAGVVLINTYDTPGPDDAPECPALVVTSPGDEVVPPGLAPTHYPTTERLEHGNGHRMPKKASEATAIVDFMIRCSAA